VGLSAEASRTARVGRLSALCLLLLASPACAEKNHETKAVPPSRATPQHATVPRNEMVKAIGDVFQEKNAKLSTVGVLEVRSWDFLGPRVVIGWSIVGDKVFRGNFNDEMFGVFVVDESLTRVERVLDVFPTPRWFDYQLRIARLTGDSVEVAGAGATYGDDPLRKAYKWR
jgi:hypothetical protein